MLRFNIGQLMLLTALAALVVALGTTLYTRAKGMFHVETVAFSPSGEAVAARYSDGTVIVWNRQGQRLGTFDTREGWLNFSFGDKRIHLLDEQRLLACNNVGQFQVWDVQTGKPSPPFGSANFAFREGSVSVSRDGTTAVTTKMGAATAGVEIWDVKTGKKIKQMPARMGMPSAVGLSEDGSQLAAIAMSDGVEVWDIESEQVIQGPHSFAVEQYAVDCLFDVSGDLRVVANYQPGRYDEKGWPIELLDTSTGQRPYVYVDHEVAGIRLAPDGTKLAVFGPSDAVTILDTQNGDTICKIDPTFRAGAYDMSIPFNESPPLAFSPDGSEVMVASNVEVGIYDATTGKLNKRLWHSKESLSKWFFMPAFIGWGLFWGVARRRQREGFRQTDQDLVTAEVVDSQGEVTGSRLPGH